MSLPDDIENHPDYDASGVRDARKQMNSRIGWIVFNIILLVVGLGVSTVFPLVLIGIILFCPYSIIKNTYQYFKVRKNLNKYLNQFK